MCVNILEENTVFFFFGVAGTLKIAVPYKTLVNTSLYGVVTQIITRT
jgi:hypothetical protein